MCGTLRRAVVYKSQLACKLYLNNEMRTTGRQTALFGALAAALGLRAVHALGSGWNCGTSPHQPGPFQLWMNEFHHNGDAEDSTEVVALSALNTTLSRVDSESHTHARACTAAAHASRDCTGKSPCACRWRCKV